MGDNAMKIGLGLLLVAGALAGCVAGETVLMRNDKGELTRCEVTAGDARRAGLYGRKRTIANCVAAYEKAGYVKVEGPK